MSQSLMRKTMRLSESNAQAIIQQWTHASCADSPPTVLRLHR
jgi:hypothetical protein